MDVVSRPKLTTSRLSCRSTSLVSLCSAERFRPTQTVVCLFTTYPFASDFPRRARCSFRTLPSFRSGLKTSAHTPPSSLSPLALETHTSLLRIRSRTRLSGHLTWTWPGLLLHLIALLTHPSLFTLLRHTTLFNDPTPPCESVENAADEPADPEHLVHRALSMSPRPRPYHFQLTTPWLGPSGPCLVTGRL